MAAADGMGMGRCVRTPPRPSWDLAMGLNMDKPKAVAQCLIAGYRDWTVKSYKGQEPKWTTIDPGMGKIDQLIQDDANGRFDELVGRVSPISKEKLDKSLVPWPDQEKVVHYRAIRTAAIVAEMKHQGVEVTEMNAVHLAAILCAAVPTDPAFLVPYNDAFAYEECVGVTGNALPWTIVLSRLLSRVAKCGFVTRNPGLSGRRLIPRRPWSRRLPTKQRWRLESILYRREMTLVMRITTGRRSGPG